MPPLVALKRPELLFMKAILLPSIGERFVDPRDPSKLVRIH